MLLYESNEDLVTMVETLNFYLEGTKLTKCVSGDVIDLFNESGENVFTASSIEHCVAYLKGISYVTGV